MEGTWTRSICLRIVCSIWLAAASALADGKGFSTAIEVVDTPDQRVLIWFKGGRQRMVVETTLDGEGDMAWVVPCPSPPRVRPVSRGVFRTLEVQLGPEVVTRGHGYQLGLFFLLFLGAISFAATRARPARTLPWMIGIIFLFAGLFTFLLLPRASLLGSAVTVHDRARVGDYDVATLSASRPDDLLAWLAGNGFRVAPAAEEVIGDYVRDGWSFAAAKVADGAARRSPHPLAFEFSTDDAVYPVRLTGVGNGPCAVDLYVVGDQRARVADLDLVHCARVGSDVTLAHEGLRGLADDGDVVTRLRGVLDPEQMRRDIAIAWVPYAWDQAVVHTTLASIEDAAGAATGTVILAFLGLALVTGIVGTATLGRRAGRRWGEVMRDRVTVEKRGLCRIWAIALGAGVVVGVVVFQGHTRTEAVAAPHLRWGAHEDVAVEVIRLDDIELARARARELWSGLANPYTGRPVIEEDSPGNYTLEIEEGRIAYRYYAENGRAITPRRTP